MSARLQQQRRSGATRGCDRKSATAPSCGSLAPYCASEFLDGTKGVQAKVASAAEEWLDSVNLRFEFGNDPAAEVRIAFNPKLGSWSFIGTDSLVTPPDSATVNLGWLDRSTRQEEVKRVVQHEMGHVLGLLHESGNPASKLKWDRPKVYATLGGPPNFWTRENVDSALFSVWPPGYFPIRKVFDRGSIMMFPQPAEFFKDGEEIAWNSEISPVDRQFVAALYPGIS